MTLLTDLYTIDHYIDTFALGHYARVLSATDKRHGGTVAFKVLRPEHLLPDGEMKWEYRAFGNEATILHALKDSPHLAHLRDCGYVSTIGEAPADGEIVSFGTDITAFNRSAYEYALGGWRPYLTIQHLPRLHNLFFVMRSQTGKGWRLPSEEGLSVALQFAQVMSLAHAQGIVYLDHKLEHLYWDGTTLRLIDFNSSRQLKDNPKLATEIAKDIHNLCVGILYPIFTGMAAQQGSLRPQPGGLDVVESRYTDVRELDFSSEPTLSPAIQTLLNKGANHEYATVSAFMVDLQKAAVLHGRDFPPHTSTPSARQARDIVKSSLKDLREGVNKVRTAREALRDALALEELPPDLEDELRRLVKGVNDMLNHRVIP